MILKNGASLITKFWLKLVRVASFVIMAYGPICLKPKTGKRLFHLDTKDHHYFKMAEVVMA